MHGGDTIKEAYKVRGDDELTQAKNQILMYAFTDPDKLISKFRNLTPAQADKIKAFSKSQIGTMQAANGQNIDNANKQADKFQPVNEKEINTMAAIANAGKNSKHQENINELNIKNEINKIVTGKTERLSEFLDSQISEKKSLLSSEATSVSQKKILQTQLIQYELIQKAYKDNPLEAAKSFKVFASPIADDSNNGIKKLNLGNFLQNPYQDLSSLEQAGKERAAQSTHVEKDIPGAKSTVFLNSEVDEVVSALTNAKNDRQLMGTFKVIAKASGGKGLDAFKQIIAKDKDLVGHAFIGGLTNVLPEQEGNRLLALYTKGYFLSKNKTVGVELGNETNRPKIEAVNKYLNNIFNQDPITAKGVKDAAVNIWLGKKVSEGKSTTTIDGDFDKIVSNLLGGTDSHGGIDTSLNQKNIAVAPMWLPKNKLSDVLEMFKNKPELFKKATGDASGLGTATNETFNPFDVKYPETTGDYGETIIEDKNVRYPSLVNVGNGVYKLAYGDPTQPTQEQWIVSDSGNSNNKELTVNLNLIKDEVLQIIKDNEITFAKTVRGVGSYIGSGIEAMATIDKTPSQLNATISNTSKKDKPIIAIDNKVKEMGITGDLLDMVGQIPSLEQIAIDLSKSKDPTVKFFYDHFIHEKRDAVAMPKRMALLAEKLAYIGVTKNDWNNMSYAERIKTLYIKSNSAVASREWKKLKNLIKGN